LLRGYTCLIERGRFDEIAHSFSLGKIDAAIQKCAQSEFTGFSETRAGLYRPVEAVPQDYRRAVAGNFDNVFGGIGMRRREVCRDYFIDETAIVAEKLCERGLP